MKTKDIIKFIKETKKTHNYHWEKEGKEIIHKINDKNINKEEIKKILSILLITEEVPNKLVTDFWLSCSGAKEEMFKNKGQYKKYIKAFNILIKNKHPFYLYMERKMSVDLNRSFKIKVNEENINQLRNILSAFTVRDVSLNYCQGFNSITAYLLQMINFKEEESFYLFLQLMEKILPYDYYLYGIGIEAEINILTKLVEKYEPDLINHLKKYQSDIVLYTTLTQFITSLLIFKMDINITNILFNCFFGFALLGKKGDIFFYFYKIILAIFKALKNDIMKCKNMQKISEILNLEKVHKKEIFQSIIYFTLFDENKNNFDINYTKKVRQEEVNKIISTKKYKFRFTNENKIQCNFIYPICVEEYKYPTSIELNAIYESLNNDNLNNINNIINDEENDEMILKSIRIERRRHYCHLKKIKDKYNYQWEKEGKEIIDKINDENINKEEFKKILSILLITDHNIPQDLFLNFWLKCSGTDEIISQNKGQYKKLVKAFNILIKNKHPFYLYMEKKISVDLNRSFNNMKEKVSPENINQLRDILYAFTVRNVSINYCQGLNSIVSYFLQMTNFKEEESFYLFLKLMEKILPYNYYLFGIGVEAEVKILNILLEKYEPDLIKHLKDIQSDILLFSVLTKFVTSLFTFQTAQNITNLAFNCFFGFALLEEKDEVFFYFYKIVLSIIKYLKPDLMKCEDMKDINQKLKLIDKEIREENIEITIYYTFFDESNKFDINYAKKLRQEEINKIVKDRKIQFKGNNENNIKCNAYYPLCVKECDISSVPQFNVIYERINDKKENNNNENEINNEEDDDTILKSIIIERRKHYCQE